MIEIYAIKPFVLGSVLTIYFYRKWIMYNKPRTFQIVSFKKLKEGN
jgi:hypothetical protein